MACFKVCVRTLESMSNGEQLRTKEAWIPEVTPAGMDDRGCPRGCP